MFEAKIRNKFHSCNLLCHVILSGGLSPESKDLQQIPPLAALGRNDSEPLGGFRRCASTSPPACGVRIVLATAAHSLFCLPQRPLQERLVSCADLGFVYIAL